MEGEMYIIPAYAHHGVLKKCGWTRTATCFCKLSVGRFRAPFLDNDIAIGLINSVRKNRVGAAGAQQKDGWGCQDEHQVLEPVGNWQRVSSRNGSSTNLQSLS